MSDAEWADLFRRYRAIPQYRIVNPGHDAAGLQVDLLVGVEPTACWAGLIGVIVRRAAGRAAAHPPPAARLVWPCVGLFFLGGLQGLVGWWMVKQRARNAGLCRAGTACGPPGPRPYPVRALIWTGLEAGWGREAGRRSGLTPGWRIGVLLYGVAAVYLQCLMGALVAGNHAGLANADWPLMSGRFFPADYWQGGFVDDAGARFGRGAVQPSRDRLCAGRFHPRACPAAQARSNSRFRSRSEIGRRWLAVGIVALQTILGISLLLGGVPTGLALGHQFTACALLATATGYGVASRTRYYDTLDLDR